MVGGAISGYSAIGTCVRQRTPASTVTTEITIDSLGRSMNICEIILLTS